MSYVDNLSGQFGELGIGGDRPGSQSYQAPPPGSGQHGEYGYHAPSQDGPPPAQYYASPPQPTYQPPSDKPPLPQGWTPLFDQSRQRWYYANKETGVTQWEAPGYIAPRPPMDSFPSEESRGSGSSPYPPSAPYGQTPGGYSAPPGPPPSASYGAPPGPPPSASYGAPSGPPPAGYGAPAGEYSSHGDEGRGEEKKKSSGKGGLLLGAAGGVAAGLVGGAILHHVFSDDSDDEERRQEYAQQAPSQTVIVNEYNTNEYNDSYYDGGAPGILPARDAEGNYVSESDRESVQEAREEYEEALADAQDSSASSSDYEELAEAREEYYEEYEETYD
ncbi:hypothetical protein TARUN_3680 [Trichoderma arundinaceum]|uniref:WW domain-containing protein n=1 Tax=Trichoderma arundinaceum TaxID=490622 RepID=A0A395NR26_TRIAR|nr:hypothetical protein TARUN_3680 [Trichoderma arundinaceum]